VNRSGGVTGERLGEKVVWQMLKKYATEVGVPGIAPHDLRRTCAKLCRPPAASWSRSSCCWATPRSDYGTISGNAARSGARAERRDQTDACSGENDRAVVNRLPAKPAMTIVG
jgi:hypothetical protein